MKPKLRYCIHKNSPLDPVLSDFKPVHTFTPYLLKILLNIILPSTSKYSIRFSDKNFVCISYLLVRTIYPFRFIIFDLITIVIFCVEYKLRSYKLCIFLHSPVSSYLLDPNILLTLCSKTLSMYLCVGRMEGTASSNDTTHHYSHISHRSTSHKTG